LDFFQKGALAILKFGSSRRGREGGRGATIKKKDTEKVRAMGNNGQKNERRKILSGGWNLERFITGKGRCTQSSEGGEKITKNSSLN